MRFVKDRKNISSATGRVEMAAPPPNVSSTFALAEYDSRSDLPLWPIHYKPLPHELLSSWLVRLAHGHGLEVKTFCNLILSNNQQVWNRDIDRLAPTWLLDQLSTTPKIVWITTLRAKGLLYEKFRTSGTLSWSLALKIYHRKREGYGLQFCPACLSEDAAPYFRKRWRIAFNTLCLQHKSMLLDRCPRGNMAVANRRLASSRGAIQHAPKGFYERT